jgi:hypothetical protein
MAAVGSSRIRRSGLETTATAKRALHLAAREARDLLLRDVGHARAPHGVFDGQRMLVEGVNQCDGLPHGRGGKERAALEHRAHPPRDDRAAGVLAEQLDRAVRWYREPEEQVDRGGLARPVGSEECDDLARPDREVHGVHGRQGTELLTQTRQPDRRCWCHVSIVSRSAAGCP